ncbi:MAG: hypothetical protein U0T02_08935 [Solirubrobacteraceae bacterium]
MRRALAPLALAAVLLAGCGAKPGALPNGAASDTLTAGQRQARMQLLQQNGGLNDRELAKLCPALYPRDFETAKKYKDIRAKQKLKKTTFPAADRALAKRAGCR